MRVFKVADGTNWAARLHDTTDDGEMLTPRVGWEAVLFEGGPGAVAQRLVYRPHGWLATATTEELAAALDEGVAIRLQWGD